MKRILSLVLCLFLVLGVFSAFAGGGSESAAAPSAPKKISANVASTFPPDSPQDVGLNLFKKRAEEQSGGNIQIQIHTSGTMGDEVQTFELLSQGSVEYGAIAASHISLYYPKFYICEVPYFFSSQDDFWKFWNGPGRELADRIEKERNVRTEGTIFRGTRDLTANKAIRTVADMKGLKMRLAPLKLQSDCWGSLGAIPSPIAFSEVYLALKNGVVEAQENPPESILNYKFYEAQKFIMLTEHIHAPATIVSSVLWWNTVDSASQAILKKAMAEGIARGNELTKNGDAEFVKKLEGLGMTVVTVDKLAFKKALQPTIDKIAKEEWDLAFYEKTKALLAQ
jgi:tripartite ATP-independent transporter DctP family solute receptor